MNNDVTDMDVESPCKGCVHSSVCRYAPDYLNLVKKLKNVFNDSSETNAFGSAFSFRTPDCRWRICHTSCNEMLNGGMVR